MIQYIIKILTERHLFNTNQIGGKYGKDFKKDTEFQAP